MGDIKNNTGVENSGDKNSGDWNSGDWNSGDWNSGYGNSGYGNSGDWNSGNRNSSDCNSGNRNSGYRNSGDWNSGYGNSTDRESGIFNSTKGTLRMFNKPTDKEWNDIDHPYFRQFYLNKWIWEDEMTDEEKKANPKFYVRQGYLKTYSWEEAWANYWRDTDDKDRQRVLNLPNFDPEVFKEITGIDVEAEKPIETIDIGGKTYEVTNELKKALSNLKEVK